MSRITLIVAASLGLGAIGAAEAGTLGRPCTAAPQDRWLTIEDLKAKVEAKGYKVQKAKISKACGELYALDKNGARIELFVDPTNGEIVGQL